MWLLQRLTKDMLIPIELFGETWVLFRDENGHAACVKDECAHRACPLSLGSVIDGHVQCPYHGWEYNAEGVCTKMPSTAQCSGVTVSSLPCAEHHGEGPDPLRPTGIQCQHPLPANQTGASIFYNYKKTRSFS